MSRLQTTIVALAGLLCLAGCGPSVTVTNKTRFIVTVVVSAAGDASVLSPSAGESSTAEVTEGAFKVTVIPNTDWLAWAKLTRKSLNDQLADSSKLSGPQLLEVIQRLKDIAGRMKEYEDTAGKGASCAGVVSSDVDAAAEVTQAADGSLVVVCK